MKEIDTDADETWALMLVPACGSNKAAPTTPATAQTTDAVSCAADSRVSPYAPSMQVPGAGRVYTFTIVAMQPGSPATGAGAMTVKVKVKVKVTDKSGNAVNDAALSLALFMPDHGHGSSVTPQVAAANGVYNVTNIYLFMPGVWRRTFNSVDADKSETDSGAVLFCIPG